MNITLHYQETLQENTINVIFLTAVLLFAAKFLVWRNHPVSYDKKRFPPLVPYYLPFFGSGLEMAKDPIAFIQKWASHFNSDMISIYAAGRIFVIVLNPRDSSLILSGRFPQLSWEGAKRMIFRGVALVSEEATNKNIEISKQQHALLESHLLKKDSLEQKLLSYQSAMISEVIPTLLGSKEQKDFEKKEIGLLEFLGRNIYFSTAKTLFKFDALANEEMYQANMEFDKAFGFFMTNPSEKKQKQTCPNSYAAREKVVERIRALYTHQPGNEEEKEEVHEKFSDYVNDLYKVFVGIEEGDDLYRHLFITFAASFINTIPAAFWVVFQLLSNKDAYEAIQEEVDALYKKKKSKGANSLMLLTLEDIEQLKCLDSLLLETVRLTLTPKSFRGRKAMKDFELKLNDKQFFVKAGTTFLICKTFSHRDKDVFEDPLTFKWDRFLNSPTFSKNGRRLPEPVVSPFGGGPSMCPGRRLAYGEIKVIVAHLLSEFHVEFVSSSPDPPKFLDSKTWTSSGMPGSDVPIRFTKRV